MFRFITISLTIIFLFITPFTSHASQVSNKRLIQTSVKKKNWTLFTAKKNSSQKNDPITLANRSQNMGLLALFTLFAPIFIPVGIVLAFLAIKYSKRATSIMEANPEKDYGMAPRKAKSGKKLAKIALWLYVVFVAIVTVGLILFPIY